MNLEHIYRAWRYRLKLDANEIKYLLKNIKKEDIAIDIGAHKGAYTYWMKQCVGKNGKVIAFEPQKKLADYLKKQYQHCSNVVIENTGISSQETEMTLHIPHENSSPGASFNKNHDDILKSRQTHEVSVKTTTLDNYIKKNNIDAVRFIKCDVEGHELDVFHGAKNLLTHQKPILLFECENRHQKQRSINDVFSYLENLHYKGYFFIHNELQPIDQFDIKKYQSNANGIYINNFIFEPIL